MIDVRSWIHRCCQRLNRGVVLKVAAEWLALWLCLFGAVVIVVKRVWPELWPHMLWAGLTAIPVLYFARRRALQQRFLASDGAALLDDRLGTRGLLMTVAERHDPQWGRQLPADEAVWAAALPRVRPVRFAKIVVLPAVFLGIALTLPAKERPRDGGGRRQRPRLKAVTQLPQMLEELKKADVLDPEEHRFLKEEVDKIVEETSKAPPNTEQWRKIDELRARLQQRLAAEARTLKTGRQAVERLAQAEKSERNLTQAELKQLEKDLNTALARLGKRQGLPSASPKQTAPKQKSPTQPGKLPTAKDSTKVAGKTPPAAKKKDNQKPPSKQPPKTAAKKQSSAKGGKKKDGPEKVATKADGKQQTKKAASNSDSKQPTGKKIAKGNGRKTPSTVGGKTPQPKKQAGKKQSPTKQVAGKQPKPKQKASPKSLPRGVDQIPDLAKLLEMVDKIPPEMQQEIQRRLMQMAQSGELRIPDDPELRRRLMQQARKLLEQNADKLDELRRRFGKVAENLPQRRRDTKSRQPDKVPGGVGQPVPGQLPSGKSQSSKTAFRDIVLPPGFADQKQTQLDRVVGKTPKVEKVRPSVVGNGNEKIDSSNWQTWKRKYPPRYRALLRKYFQSGE